MKALSTKVAVIAGVVLLALASSAALATIVSFDDLPLGEEQAIPTNYAGLTWGTDGSGVWAYLHRLTYSTPQSPENYAYNGAGMDALWIQFPVPVTLNGA